MSMKRIPMTESSDGSDEEDEEDGRTDGQRDRLDRNETTPSLSLSLSIYLSFFDGSGCRGSMSMDESVLDRFYCVPRQYVDRVCRRGGASEQPIVLVDVPT